MGDEEEKKSDCVKVAVRMRPLSTKELGNYEKSIVDLEEHTSGHGTGSIIINDPEAKERPATFAFDIVFGTDTQQQTVFETVGKPAVDSTLNGYNGTIFAYGQTGSGKSWCMTGGAGDLRGIIPRVNEDIFVRIAAEQEAISTRRFLVMCSFYEIYNEIIFDLLNPVQDRSKLGAGLQVKEHPVLGIYVKDLQEIVVTDADKLEKLMASGTKNRAVSSTMMNSASSRSHSIFTIKVHQKDDEDTSKNVFAKLNLVDLAGSERQKGTGATGQTLKEGANINKSLSALGNVINALVENANGKKVFVPFRNSKLTRVLQESLGGNSLCTMLATLSPAACNYEETLSTLRYANRAKAIKVSATKNEEASQISRLNTEIEELKKKLAMGGSMGGGGLLAAEERREIQDKFQAQLAEMQHMVSSTWEEKARLSADHEAQLSKALDEQRRQARAMQEECRKRFRLLQDQNDLELSIRGLMDTVQSLPPRSKPEEAEGAAAGRGCGELCTGELPRQWLKMAGALAEVAISLKQQHTVALVFHGAFCEDLKLWVDGEDAADHAMARTGARRALTKLETLRRECEKLASLEAQGQSKATEFAQAVMETHSQWTSVGLPALTEEFRGSGGPTEVLQDSGVPCVWAQTLEDIGLIMQLIGQQAQAKAEAFNSAAALEVRSTVELVLRGSSLVPNASPSGADAELLRSLAQADETPTEREVPAAAELPAKSPRKDRPLHEWAPEEVDDTVEGTEFVLSKVVPLDQLNKKRTAQELLARPPPKFVHDVALLVQKATGFLPGLSEEWPEPREGKIDLLQHIADSVASALGLGSVDFDPENVLKGKEVPATLRLLQLLAIAAAREGKQLSIAVSSTKVHRDRRKAAGMTSARDIARMLDAIGRCVQAVLDQQASRGDRQPGSGHASPTRELESQYRMLQERLEEERQLRLRQGDRLAALQKEVEATRSLLRQQSAQLEERRQAATDVDARKSGLRKQVNDLRAGLLKRADEIDGNPQVSQMRADLKEVSAKHAGHYEMKAQLQEQARTLQEELLETDKNRETLEMEVRRMKLRAAEGIIDGPKCIHQSEDILVLQAEKQKWDVTVMALEEKLRLILETDDSERQLETGLLEEKRLQSLNHEDVQMQLQVIIEERDGLRESMDLLWQEKTRAEEELEELEKGYTNLSDRLLEKTDERNELEEQLQQYENLLSMLQTFEKSRQSPVMVDHHKLQAQPPLPPVESLGTAALRGNAGKQTTPRGAPKADGDDAASSHYSDEDFEEPDED